ncbi:hypothetical protein HZC07_00010 [Candidatus Micrarchaeota archaeon]|nr:hypothetical protein [Candidatus Micrarchaeota archaeon]
MKRTEYSEVSKEPVDKLAELDAEKHDDYELPDFSREVPISSRTKTSGDSQVIEYEWKDDHSQAIRIKKITFRKNELLAGLHRIAARDGADSITFKHDNTTYILRKTIKEVAEAVYSAYGKIKAAIENIVGYIKTAIDNYYIISRVDHQVWSFDRRIARNGIDYVDVDALERDNKSRLCDMITEKIADLHSGNLIIGRFNMNNVLLDQSDMKFTDLRLLRVSRKRSFVIEEFKNILQYLFAIGVATKEDIYASVAYYATRNEDGCKEWYQQKTGKRAKDVFDIAMKIENEVYN